MDFSSRRNDGVGTAIKERRWTCSSDCRSPRCVKADSLQSFESEGKQAEIKIGKQGQPRRSWVSLHVLPRRSKCAIISRGRERIPCSADYHNGTNAFQRMVGAFVQTTTWSFHRARQRPVPRSPNRRVCCHPPALRSWRDGMVGIELIALAYVV